MSRIYVQSEGTAARRRFPVYLVDATDGITAETGESGGQPQISKAGGAWGNTTATLTAIGNGYYYVELTATELDTLGVFAVRYKSANTAEFNMDGVVVAINVHDTVRAGLTALPNAAADAAGGLPISDAGGLDLDALNTNVSAILADTGTDGVLVSSGTGTGQLDVTSGVVKSNLTQIAGDAGDATKLGKAAKTVTEGTVTTGATTTSIPTSSLNPAASVTDQFKGLILKFTDDTTTAALRGQGTDITASTAGGTLTVTALTTAPANGDTFTIQ